MTFTNIQSALDYIINHPDERDAILANWPALRQLWDVYVARQQYESGEATAQDVLKTYGEAYSVNLDPETEKWLDNEISRENTAADNQFQQQMRDTSITSTATQLQGLGLSPSNVISVGGAASGVTSNAATTNKHSAAALHQQARINDYNQKIGMAKQLISTAGSMASSGIYGAALGATKNAAAKLATATAHSGLNVLKHHSSQKMSAADNVQWEGLMKELGTKLFE